MTPGYPFRPRGKERGGHTLARPITASSISTRPLPLPASSDLAGSTPSLPERAGTSSDKQFATEAVADRRYRDVSAVIAARIALLRERDAARGELLASVRAAQEESERDGYLTAKEVADRVRATIARRANAAA